jgi:hypothetical protein
MEGYNIGRKKWTDEGCVDVKGMFAGGANDAERGVLLVDIGGGTGRDIIEFQQRYPDLKGRLVLQDLQSVIDEVVSLPSGVETMAHDFFTPQPIQGSMPSSSL